MNKVENKENRIKDIELLHDNLYMLIHNLKQTNALIDVSNTLLTSAKPCDYTNQACWMVGIAKDISNQGLELVDEVEMQLEGLFKDAKLYNKE